MAKSSKKYTPRNDLKSDLTPGQTKVGGNNRRRIGVTPGGRSYSAVRMKSGTKNTLVWPGEGNRTYGKYTDKGGSSKNVSYTKAGKVHGTSKGPTKAVRKAK